MCLPIGHRLAGSSVPLHRDFTIDVAAGGVHFSASGASPSVGQRLDVELTVPPGDGYSPYGGKVRGVMTVLRCKPLDAGAGRWMVAGRFDEPLNLEF